MTTAPITKTSLRGWPILRQGGSALVSRRPASPKALKGGRGGQTIIEAILAISVLTFGLLSVLSLLNRSLSLNRVIADNYRATYLAAEGIEIARNLVDYNVNFGEDPSATRGCQDSDGVRVRCISEDLDDGCYELTYTTDFTTPGNAITPLRAAACVNFGDASVRQLRYHDTTTHLYDYDNAQSIETPFRRIVQIESAVSGSAPYRVRVNSMVEWRGRGGGTFRVNLEDYFYDFRPVP